MIKVKDNNVYHIPNMALPWSTDRLLKVIKDNCIKHKKPFSRNAYYQTMENNGMMYFGLYAKKYTKGNEMSEYTMSQVLYQFAVSSIVNFTYFNDLIAVNGVEYRMEYSDISKTLFNVLGQMGCNWDYKQKKSIIDSVIDKLSVEYIKSKRYDLKFLRQELCEDKDIMKYYDYWFLEKITTDDNKIQIPRIHQIGEKRQKRWSNIKYKNGGYCLFLPNREKQCLRTIYNNIGNGTREYLQTLDSRGLFFTPDRKDKNSNHNWHNFQNNIKKVTLPKQPIDIQTCERTLSEYFLDVVYPFFDHVEMDYGNLSATTPASSATTPVGSATTSTLSDSEKVVASTASSSIIINSNSNIIRNRHFTLQLQTLPTNEQCDEEPNVDKLATEDRPKPPPEDSQEEIDNEDAFWNDLINYNPEQKKK